MVFRRKPPEEVARHNITVPLTERALHQLERAAILCRTTRTALAREFIIGGVTRALALEVEEKKLVDTGL